MPEKNAEREERILAAAARLIEHYGFDKTTVEEIAQAAGVSKGAVYLHFRSKDALFEALLLRDTEALLRRYWELIEADPRGISLFTMYRYGLIVVDESPLLKAIYTRDRRVLGDFTRRLREAPAYAQALNVSVEFVRHFQQAGMIRRDLDAEALAYLLGALRYGVLTMDDTMPPGQPAPSVAQLGDTLAEMLATGLEPRAGEADPEAARQALQRLFDVRRQFMEENLHKRP